jgi:flagellar basal-body rod modification protein FlgD
MSMIEGTTATATAGTAMYSGTTPAAAPKQGMDQETFLTLLVAQLRNQDPSSPMDTTEMMAQSTQLASMEQLTAMADTTRESFALQMRIAATGLVGQQVGYVDSDGVRQTGVATGVSFAGSTPMVTVGDTQVPLDSVSAIGTVPAGADDASTDSPSDSSSDSSETSTPAA